MAKQTTQNIKTKTSQNSILIALIKGLIYGYLVTIPVFVLFSLILTYTMFPEKHIPLVILITTIISVVFAGLTSVNCFKDKGWLLGGITGFLYMVVLYFLNGIVLRNFTLDKHVLINSIICVLSGSIGGIMGLNTKPKQGLSKRIKTVPKRKKYYRK
jgi:putative membrane protein (TIGR04086 family)